MAQVKGADLRKRDLRAAVANNAFLVKARLDKANLQGANFQGADLREVDFAGADLRRTELGGANLEDAKNLSQEQLDVACGDKATKLPKGLTINLCGSKQRTPAVKNSIRTLLQRKRSTEAFDSCLTCGAQIPDHATAGASE
jgi:uncharacterized protein YjbI with pentapeptide repeats